MCGICGFYSLNQIKKENLNQILEDYKTVLSTNSSYGLDAYGYLVLKYNEQEGYNYYYEKQYKYFSPSSDLVAFNNLNNEDTIICSIANFRAIPTVEVDNLIGNPFYDIQPFYVQDKDGSFIAVVHNGVTYNHDELLNNNSLIRELLPKDKDGKIPTRLVDTFSFIEVILRIKRRYDESNIPFVINRPEVLDDLAKIFEDEKMRIKGSYSLAMILPDTSILLARTYLPLFLGFKDYGDKTIVWFSSDESVLKEIRASHIRELSPFSFFTFNPKFSEGRIFKDYEKGDDDKAVVLCSGGLDTCVVATLACKENKEVTLMHFKYGCLAEEKEIKAVKEIANYLSDNTKAIVKVKFIDLSFFKELGGSTIIDSHENIAEGEMGVRTHNEWVPARNLVMLSLASAFCDRYKIGKIYTGFNMEESLSYPDNSISFSQNFDKTVDVGTTSRPNVISPLWNLVKHQIVKLGLKINAPLHLSWSCYYNYDKHCGKCGPCYMRKKSEEIANKTFTEYLE